MKRTSNTSIYNLLIKEKCIRTGKPPIYNLLITQGEKVGTLTHQDTIC